MTEHKQLTIKEAAEYLGLNPMTVRRWLTAKESPKKLPNARRQAVGNVETWLIPMPDLEAVLAQGPAPEPKGFNLTAEIERYCALEVKVAELQALADERLAWVQSLERQLKGRSDEVRSLLAINSELVARFPKYAEVSN